MEEGKAARGAGAAGPDNGVKAAIQAASKEAGPEGAKRHRMKVIYRVLLSVLLLGLLAFIYIYFMLPGTLPWNDPGDSGWYGDTLEYLEPGASGAGELGMLGEFKDLGLPSVGDDDVFAVLILGFDYDYPGTIRQGGGVPGRTDAIMLLVVPKDRNYAMLVSIPRDTLVPIDGYGTEDRINSLYKGISLRGTMNAVTYLTGVEPDRWVSVDFKGFVKIVDRLGGVDVRVDDRMVIWDDLNGRWVTIQPGLQHFDGSTALMYIRFRGDQMGDISRTARQLKFIKSLAAKAAGWDSVMEVGGIIADLQDSIKTNLSSNEAVALGMRLLKIGTSRLDGFSIPGSFEGPYWRADVSASRRLMEEAIAGRPAEDGQGEESAPATDGVETREGQP